MGQEYRQAMGGRKGKGLECPLEPPEGTPCRYPDFSPVRLLISRTVQIQVGAV